MQLVFKVIHVNNLTMRPHFLFLFCFLPLLSFPSHKQWLPYLFLIQKKVPYLFCSPSSYILVATCGSVEVYWRGKGLFLTWNLGNLRKIAPRAFGTRLTIKLYLLCLIVWIPTLDPCVSIFLLQKQFGIISSLCILVLGTSLGFMRCVNNTLGLSKVIKL